MPGTGRFAPLLGCLAACGWRLDHAPYGFRANGKRHCMDPIPRELVIVRRILEAWRAGGTYAGIARDLNAEGVPTKRGARWHASTVRGIVQRRAWYADILGGV